MHNIRGKLADNLGKVIRITRAQLSTISNKERVADAYGRAQPEVSPKIIPRFTLGFSPLKFAPIPLTEHYLYPVSTAPINTITKEKLKKGNSN
jgi:hypothetical protein